MAKKKRPEKREKICEVFKKIKEKVKKRDTSKEFVNGKIIKKCGVEKEVIENQGQIKKENKILKNLLIWLGIISFFIILGFFIAYFTKNFEYQGVKFEIVDEIAPYKTSLPVLYEGKKADYNFYLRNDPRKLDSLSFNGELVLLENVVINMTEDFNCDGDGIIGIANLVKLYEIIGANVIKDENATCDSQGRFMFVQIQSGEVTSIEQFGPTCYNLNVNNCEILKVTERFMIETLAKVNELI